MHGTEADRTYIAIDLKSFYASVECVERNLDPLTTHLVVADASRTEKSICLAVSPSLKAYGIPGRARLFEVVQRMKEVNRERLRRLAAAHRTAGGQEAGKGTAVFSGKSVFSPELQADPSLEADYIVAVPRMAHYIEWSTRIYKIYLRYIAPEDIHVYSIDEVMMDVTKYLPLYHKTAHELAREMIRAVLRETGITATAGIGTNLYLCKIAMDIEAKHTEADEDGVRIAELDEISYRKKLWGHRPITDFWRVGKGTAGKLARYGIYTMGDIARCSLQDEDLLYNLFGINAELLIDHAWGWEPCTIELIRKYKPQKRSFSAGQVLPCPYEADKARIVLQEMADAAALSLVEKRLVTDQMVLTVIYDIENLKNPALREKYRGEIKPAQLLVRRIYLSTNNIAEEVPARQEDPDVYGEKEPEPAQAEHEKAGSWQQMDLFTDYEEEEHKREQEQAALEKERRLQEAMLSIRRKYGKNAILKGTNLQEGATMRDRNKTIGGHKA